MQPIAASVCTAISASSSLRALTTSKPEASDLGDDLVETKAFEIVGVEDGCCEQKGEASEVIHRDLLRMRAEQPVGAFDDTSMTMI